MKPKHETLRAVAGWRVLEGPEREAALYWWREGRGARDLRVTDARREQVTRGGVDWRGFPAAPPAGFEAAPVKGRATVATLLRLTPEAREMLEQKAEALGLDLATTVGALLAADKENA